MKRNYYKELLGATQQEMAMLLNISRSQWTKFIAGQRMLPYPAMQTLTEMVIHAEARKKEKPSQEINRPEPKHLSTLLRENQYQQMVITNKMKAIEKKQAKKEKLAMRLEYLTEVRSENAVHAHHQHMAQSAASRLKEDHASILFELEVRLKVLAYERALIESKLE